VNAFKGVVLILVGTAWGLLGTYVLASLTENPFYDGARFEQEIAFFIMLLGIVPFGVGINRLVK
jgi:hypothetical protein